MQTKVRIIPLPTSTGQLVIGTLPATKHHIIEWHGFANTGTGTAIVTDTANTVVDYIAAASRSGPTTHPLVVNGPLTVTITGTVTGSAFIG